MAQELFESLDDLAWSELNHSYGTAEVIPQLLRNLASDDAGIAREAFDELFEMVWHPESLSEATPHTIPFIVEIIEKTTSRLRSDLLILLKEMVSEEDIPDHERELAEQVEDAIKAGMPAYLNLIRDEELQAEAIDLLSAFPEACDEIAPQLLEMLNEEDNPRTQYILIDGLLALVSKPGACSDKASYHAVLRKIKQSDIKALQLAATRALIKEKANAPGDNSFDIVKDSIISPENYLLPHIEPGVLAADTVRTDSLKLLKHLKTEQAVAAMEDVLEGIQNKAAGVEPPQISKGERGLFDAMQQSVQQVMSDMETQGFDQFEMDNKEGVLNSDSMQSFTGSIAGSFGNFGAGQFAKSTSRYADTNFGLNVLYLLMQFGFRDALMVKLNVKTTGHLPSGEIEFNFPVKGDKVAPDWQEISPTQLRVLQIIATYDLLWGFKTNLLSIHGFPGDREALVEWVELRAAD